MKKAKTLILVGFLLFVGAFVAFQFSPSFPMCMALECVESQMDKRHAYMWKVDMVLNASVVFMLVGGVLYFSERRKIKSETQSLKDNQSIDKKV